MHTLCAHDVGRRSVRRNTATISSPPSTSKHGRARHNAIPTYQILHIACTCRCSTRMRILAFCIPAARVRLSHALTHAPTEGPPHECVQEALGRYGMLDLLVTFLAFALMSLSIVGDRQQQLFNVHLRRMLLPPPWRSLRSAAFKLLEVQQLDPPAVLDRQSMSHDPKFALLPIRPCLCRWRCIESHCYRSCSMLCFQVCASP